MIKTKNAQPRLRDVRKVYRLLGECTELGSDSSAWRTHLMEGMCAVIGARVGLYGHVYNPLRPNERIDSTLACGFLDADHQALWQHYREEQAHKDNPYNLNYYRNHYRPIRTRTLDEVVEAREWKRSRHYNEYSRACRFEDRITSSLRLGNNGTAPFQTLVFHRDVADGNFSPGTKYLVKLLHHELAGLLGKRLVMPASRRDTGSLPPRMAQVLDHLLVGKSEKQVATSLGISHYTVNRHVQRLYQRFDVNSRAKLIALFAGGTASDR